MTEDIVVILVEDDLGHAELIKRHLLRAGISARMVHFRDAFMGLEHLKTIEPDPDRGPMCVILLDIRLPGMDGVTFLKHVRRTYDPTVTPVIVLSTTDDPKEVARCYGSGCNAYVTKPTDYGEFSQLANGLLSFIDLLAHNEACGPTSV